MKPNIQIGSLQHSVGFKCDLKWKQLHGVQADWWLRIITTQCELHSPANAYTILELSYTLPSHSSAIIAIITTNFDTNLSLESQNNTEWYQVRTSWEPWNGATTSHPSTWKVGSWYVVQPRGNHCNDRENQSITQCNKTWYIHCCCLWHLILIWWQYACLHQSPE